nr:DUF5689 domain-containing protein [Cohnella sp. YIM B05605]
MPEDHPPVPAKIAVADARQAAGNTLVTVEGVITSEPGLFGGQGFYLQDDTAGIYVYQTAAGFHAGDRVSISAKKTVYNTELELSDPVVLKKIGTADLPPAIVQSELNDGNQGQLVKLENVTIQNYKTATPAGSFEFDAVNGSNSTHVRVDGRTGIRYADFQAKFPAGSLVHVTGISSIFNGTYQLKPLAMSGVALADVTPPTTAWLADGLTGEGHYNTQDVTLTFTAQDETDGSGIASTLYRLNGGAWTAAQGPVTVSSEGKHLVEFYSKDNAGNAEAPQSLWIWIDKTAPVVSYEGTASFYQTDSSVNLTVSAADGLSGVKSVRYALDGAAIASVESNSPLAMSAGAHTLQVTAADNAGNQAVVSITLTSAMDIDHFAGLISLGESKGWFANHGTAQSLIAKVKEIQKADKDQNAAKKLEELEKQIDKAAGKHIDAAFADLLLNDLAYLQSAARP